jgi:transmembrane sensor
VKIPDHIATEAAAWIARRDAGFTPEDERAFAIWRARDPRHEKALATFGAAWTLLGGPAERGRGQVMHDLLAGAARRRRRLRASAAAAALAACALVAVFVSRPDTPPPVQAAVVIAPERLTLPDGSLVELKNGARIAQHYSAALREVRLEHGEAHFSVVSDHSRPFVVTTGGVAVRAVGTAFAVQLDRAGEVEVVVSHGTVAVRPQTAAPGSIDQDALTLDRGKLARIGSANPAQAANVRSLDAAELAERLGWRTPRIEFSKATLGEAVELFNRHRRAEMPELVAGAEVREMPISGVFRADNADAFVALLETAYGLRIQRTAGVVAIGPATAP